MKLKCIKTHMSTYTKKYIFSDGSMKMCELFLVFLFFLSGDNSMVFL